MPSISGLNDFEPYNITLIEAVNMAQNSTLSGAGQNDDDDDFIIHSPFQSHSHSLLKMTVPSQLIMTQHSWLHNKFLVTVSITHKNRLSYNLHQTSIQPFSSLYTV